MAAPAAPPPSYAEVAEQKTKEYPPQTYSPYQPQSATLTQYPPYQTGGAYAAPYAYPPPQAAPYPPPQAAPYPPPQAAQYTPSQPGPHSYPPSQDTTGYQPNTGNQATDHLAEAAFLSSSFSDRAIRHAFIKKVYLILMVQLLVTTAFIAFFVLHTPTRLWVQHNVWFYGLSYATFFVTYITLVCCPAVRRKFPGNFVALAVFTLTFSYVAGAIASYHSAEAVLIAAAITAAVTLAISLFAVQTKIDFTMCTGMIFGACMVLLFAGIAFIIVYSIVPLDMRTRYILQCAYGTVAALILALFLVFDTQMVVGGTNRRLQLSPEEHVVGALQLYLDIVFIFLIVLGFNKK